MRLFSIYIFGAFCVQKKCQIAEVSVEVKIHFHSAAFSATRRDTRRSRAGTVPRHWPGTLRLGICPAENSCLGQLSHLCPSSEGAPGAEPAPPRSRGSRREKPNPAQHTGAQTPFLKSLHPFTPPRIPSRSLRKKTPKVGTPCRTSFSWSSHRVTATLLQNSLPRWWGWQGDG